MACTHYSLQALVVDFTAHVSQQMIHAFECTNHIYQTLHKVCIHLYVILCKPSRMIALSIHVEDWLYGQFL